MKLTDSLDLNSNPILAAAYLAANERGTPPAVVSSKGYLWVKNGTPNTLMFTDDESNTVILGTKSYVFTYIYDGGFPNSEVDAELLSSVGGIPRLVVPNEFFITGMSVQSSIVCSGGTLDLYPTIGGVKVTPIDLNLQLNSTSNTLLDYKIIPPLTPGFLGVTGNRIGVMASSSALWNNGVGNIRVDIYFSLK